MTDAPLGERELDVMAALWNLGSGTVNEVRDAVSDPLAYTTILTILRNLEAKHFVRREEEGRAHRYYPLVERQSAQRSALSRLLRSFFEGSPTALLTQLVQDEELSPEELQALARSLGPVSPSLDAKGKGPSGHPGAAARSSRRGAP
jgi:BlaI family penicillinase repressor